MGKQAVTECEDGLKRFDTVRSDYKKRITESGADSYMRERVSEWVIDQCERVVKETKNVTQHLLENALRNKSVN